jgi:hypothetical protein
MLQQPEAGRAFEEGLISAGKRTREGKSDAQGKEGVQRVRRHQRSIRYTITTPSASQNPLLPATLSLRKG